MTYEMIVHMNYKEVERVGLVCSCEGRARRDRTATFSCLKVNHKTWVKCCLIMAEGKTRHSSPNLQLKC